MATPTLTGLRASVTFDENIVNATPQLLDADVVFNDADDDLDGGTLTLSGLLAEDRAGVRNEGTAAGQIGVSGANVTFGGVVIGTLAGGVGATLTITFNANATAAAIDALVQNLTYANVSDTPTASRDLLLNVTDADGADLGAVPGPATFALQGGGANPLAGIDVGTYSAPAFVDLDGDGDLDLVVGDRYGALRSFRNDDGVFVELTGAANPFAGIDVGLNSAPTFADLDGDGDLDLVVGEFYGTRSFRNDGGVFVELTGAANPFAGIDVGFASTPALVDLDGDGDLDLVVGANDGTLRSFRNDGGVFTALIGGANPFAGIDVGYDSAPTFADLDGDGDLDLVVGANDGTLRSFRNDGGVFTALIGGANPFAGIDVGYRGKPTFVDLDGDGDLDLVIGAYDGTLTTVLNTTPHGQVITVLVNAETDVLNGDADDNLLIGTAGNDVISGLGGDDTLIGGAGNDILDGGDGIDTADYSGAASGVVARLNRGVTTGDGDGGSDTFISIENLTGSDFDDLLVGNAGNNTLIGGLGADYLIGLAGNDIFIGGSGAANTLQGGLGDDTYEVSANDTLVEFAGEGVDTVMTDRAIYALRDHFENLSYTGAGDFRGVGNAGDNVMEGGAGDDVLIGGAGDDVLDGNAGVDTVDYSGAAGGVTASLFDGAAADDGDGGSDVLSEIENLIGSAFDDVLEGDAGNNVLNGGDGDDFLAGRGGADVLRGGAGFDTADYSSAAGGVFVKLVLGVAVDDGDGSSDQLISIEDVVGSAFNDTLIGNAESNILEGGLGRDVLIGLAGNDILIGGDGVVNQLQGGLGDDLYVVTANDTLVEFADEGYDTVSTTLNRYTLRANFEELFFDGVGDFVGSGNDQNNVIVGGDGDDVLFGGRGDDFLIGSSGCGCGDGGYDTALMSGLLADYLIEDNGDGSFTVTDNVADRDGVDLLVDIDELRFSDGATLVLGDAIGPVPNDKGADEAQVLPGQAEDDLLSGQDFDMPLVLPGDGGRRQAVVDLAGAVQWLDPMMTPAQHGLLPRPAIDLDAWIMPALRDDDFLLGKDADLPLVLPGADEPDEPAFDLPARFLPRIDQVMTMGEDGFLLGANGEFVRPGDHDSWLF